MKKQALETAAAALAQAMQALADAIKALNESEEPPQPAVRLYSSEELMNTFHKSRGTISQWIREGLFGDPVKVGNSIMVPQAGVDKFIADHSGPTKKRVSKAQSRSRAPAAYKGPPLGI